MKDLAIVLGLTFYSQNSYAEVKCFKELRALESTIQVHVVATYNVAAYGLKSVNYIMSTALELMAQPDTRVGGYGYGLQADARIFLQNTNLLQGKAKTAESNVGISTKLLEDCLISN